MHDRPRPVRTDLREPRPSKSRVPSTSYEHFRWGSTWVERRIPQQLNVEAFEAHEEKIA